MEPKFFVCVFFFSSSKKPPPTFKRSVKQSQLYYPKQDNPFLSFIERKLEKKSKIGSQEPKKSISQKILIETGNGGGGKGGDTARRGGDKEQTNFRGGAA